MMNSSQQQQFQSNARNRRRVHEPASPLPLPTKMFLLSIAVAALSTSTFTHQVSAFVPSSWQTGRDVTSLTRGHDANPTAPVSPSIGSNFAICNTNNHNSLQTRHYLGVCTKLWAETMSDDESDESDIIDISDNKTEEN